VVGCGTVLSAEDRLAIEALHEEWLAAELRRDIAGMLQLCTAAPVWLPPDEAPLCGRAAILDWVEQQPRATVRCIDIDQLTIDGLGSIAWKLAAFSTTLEMAGDSADAVATGVHAWLLQRDATGAWRIAVVTWTAAVA
jgi:ketosteroid isomerase-like protein